MMLCRFSCFVKAITSSSVLASFPNFRFSITVPLNRVGVCDTKLILFLKSNFS